MPVQKSFFYRNSLSIVFMSLFLVTMVAQVLTGWKTHNSDLQDGKAPVLTLVQYLMDGHFVSATFENFQSEFLQMFLYVALTVKLRQIGSGESKSLDHAEEVDREPKPLLTAPWPVRKGGWVLQLYKHSLSLAFLILFLISWVLHFAGSWKDYNTEQTLQHKPQITWIAYLGESTFWFETFQNWQSEFLSVASIVILTIFLRQQGSPESKPVDAPHSETGR